MAQQKPWEQKVIIFRKKFVAREEQFSVRKDTYRKVTDPETGQERQEISKIIAPVCKNYGNMDLCLIAKRSGICAECSNKVFQPLTDEWVGKHIQGNEKLVLFMLRQEGMRFAAVDFDKGSTFEDAKLLRDTARKMGLPGYIARSTEKGYHLYFFFDDFIQPHVFHSVMRQLFIESGFTQRSMMQEMALPEIFPKQVTYIKNQVGNGIRVPMSEPDMRKGRNCWVDDSAIPIPFEEQWDYFDSLESVNVESMMKMLEEKGIEILHAPAGRSAEQARKQEERYKAQLERGENPSGEKSSTSIKQYGDFWNIVGRCPAMMEYWARDAEGNYKWDLSNPKGLFHTARFASASLAMCTTNGEEIIRARWQGPKTDGQILQIAATGYNPPTCRWMQEQGVCRLGKHPKHGDHCMKKQPPTAIENGQLVVNPEKLPEELWSDPSPIRYASDKKMTADEIIEQMSLLFEAQKGEGKAADTETKLDPSGHPIIVPEYRPDKISDRIDSLFERARFLEASEFERVRTAVRANKWMKDKDFKEINKRIAKKVEVEEKAEKDSVYEHFTFKNKDYYLKDGYYEMSWIDGKGIRQYMEITNYVVVIEEEEVLLRVVEGQDLAETVHVEDRTFKGYVHIGNQKRSFAFKMLEWMQSGEKFLSQLIKVGGGGMMHEKSDYDSIRTCILQFSAKHRVEKKRVLDIGLHKFNHNDIYVMPSVLVTKDGILKNDQYFISMEDDVSKPLDFQIMGDDELKTLARHILVDFFGMNKTLLTMTTFAYAMTSSILEPISRATGYRKCPILWLSGDTGGGKSFVLESAQFFFGDFSKGVRIGQTGSFKAKVAVAHNFRHAMALIDDIKESISKDNGREVIQTIQNMYDRTGRPALTRDGGMRRRTDRARGLVGITAEEFPTNEASAISRLILVNTQLLADRDKGASVLKQRHLYSGFTPHLIHFVMNAEPEEIHTMWKDYFQQLHEPVRVSDGKNNADRVCENLTLIMVGFRLTMDMLYAKGAISDLERDDMCRVHFKNLELVRASMLSETRDNRGSCQFIMNLSELLVSNKSKYKIHGWGDDDGIMDDSRGVTYLGFYTKKSPNTIYIYPNVAYEAARNLATRSNKVFQSQQHVARQLFQDGHLDLEVQPNSGHLGVQRTTPSGTRMRVWPLKIESLGIDDLSKREATKNAQSGPKKYSPEDEVVIG